MTKPDPYGYDRDTDTVRVSRHDLARLLLQFRAELERSGRPRDWMHMVDYDTSFERLADAVDHGTAIFYDAPQYRRESWREPDDRMRCKLTDTYVWPEGRGYADETPPVERITEVTWGGARRARGTHYVAAGGPVPETLCGFRYSSAEGRRVRAGTPPDCPVCLRERALIGRLRASAGD